MNQEQQDDTPKSAIKLLDNERQDEFPKADYEKEKFDVINNENINYIPIKKHVGKNFVKYVAVQAEQHI